MSQTVDDLQVPGTRSSPVFEDLDGDRRKDLLTGNTSGQILFYQNVGLDTLPTFAGTLVNLPANPASRTAAPVRSALLTDRVILPANGYRDRSSLRRRQICLYRGIPSRVTQHRRRHHCADFHAAGPADQPTPLEGSPADLMPTAGTSRTCLFVDSLAATSGGSSRTQPTVAVTTA
jgi:hypothetical protein